MLKEYLSLQGSQLPLWNSGMPGVQTCCFALDEPGPQTLRPVPLCGEPLHFEVLVCLTGRLVFQRTQGLPSLLEAPGIFLLSDLAGLRSCRCSGDLGGILVTVDAATAKESLLTVCRLLGLELDTSRVREVMAAERGCMALTGTPWIQAFFERLERLPSASRERYCVLKAVELLYLLCTETPAPERSKPDPDLHAAPLMLEIRSYLQDHLGEKHTIPLLCRRFSVSPTVLKGSFRRSFGVPIHSWLIEQRLKQARTLLTDTQTPIQRVAHTVGYEGLSQFNAAFKQRFGMTPGQYRKMSETATPRPF